MKKALLMAALCTTVGTTANAQLQVGSIAPDFTLTDINGVSHHLYNYLDSGYAVIIDVSAAWCGPCWSAHQSHVFENLTNHYGPNGSITPKKVKVIFIEGESQNTTAQLHGTGTSGGGANPSTDTQGDWVTGSNYPIIDNTSQNNNYLYGGFPSFTIICRDRLVAFADAGYSSLMAQESWWMQYINADCPTTAPATGTDAKVVKMADNNSYLCSAAPKVRFQNYSKSQNITSATLKVYSGTTAVATQTWTGNLAPYAVADVQMPSFTQGGPYKYEVTVAGDAVAANNAVNNVNLSLITSSMASTAPYWENLEGTDFPTKYVLDDPNGMFAHSSNVTSGGNPVTIIGSAGTATKVGAIFFPNVANNKTGEIMLGNFNTASATAPTLRFDWAYRNQSASASSPGGNDKLEIFASTDCGQNWTSIYSESGATLSTKTGLATTAFIPSAASDWAVKTVSLNNYKNSNLFLKMKATSSAGDYNYGWFDNIRINPTTDITDVIAENGFKVYPNPAKDYATVALNVVKSTNVSVQVTDIMGRVVINAANENMAAGDHEVKISTASLPAGVYNVKVQTETGSRTERLTVIK